MTVCQLEISNDSAENLYLCSRGHVQEIQMCHDDVNSNMCICAKYHLEMRKDHIFHLLNARYGYAAGMAS